MCRCALHEREIASDDPAQTVIEIAGRYGCEAIILDARGMGALRSALAWLRIAGGAACVQGACNDRQTLRSKFRALIDGCLERSIRHLRGG